MGDLAARLSRLSPEERMLLERRLAAKAMRPATGIQLRKPDEPILLSFSQRRIWYLEQLSPGTPTYNAPNAFRGQGPIDLQAFRRAVNLVLERHTVLKTVIETSAAGEPSCRVLQEWDAVEVIAVPEAQGEQEALRLIGESAKKPFDISRDVMLRTLVVTFGATDFLIVFTSHHIAWDGVSKGIFFRELGTIYDDIATGKDPALAPLTIQYADYALWQHRSFSGTARDKEVAYWKSQLAGAPPYLDIPLDRPRPSVQRFQGAKLPFELPAPLLVEAQSLSRLEKTTLYATLLAAFQVFLLAFTGQGDISIATPFAGRDEPQTQELIGFFINTMVLRTRIDASLNFREVMSRVRETLLGAQEHQMMPMDQLVEILQSPRDLSRMPLAQVNFRLQAGYPPELKLRGIDLKLLPLIDTSISKFDMALEVASAAGEAGYVEYSTDLFTDERMSHIPGAYEALLEASIANPAMPVGEFSAYKAIGDLSPKRRRIGLAVGSSKVRSVSDV